MIDQAPLNSTLLLQKLARKYPDLDQIFKSMTDHNPQNRPSMAQVMQSMEVFLTSLTEEDLVSDDYWSSRRNPWIPEHIEFYQRLAKGVDAGLVT